jgi:hypothetical protein
MCSENFAQKIFLEKVVFHFQSFIIFEMQESKELEENTRTPRRNKRKTSLN